MNKLKNKEAHENIYMSTGEKLDWMNEKLDRMNAQVHGMIDDMKAIHAKVDELIAKTNQIQSCVIELQLPPVRKAPTPQSQSWCPHQ